MHQSKGWKKILVTHESKHAPQFCIFSCFRMSILEANVSLHDFGFCARQLAQLRKFRATWTILQVAKCQLGTKNAECFNSVVYHILEFWVPCETPCISCILLGVSRPKNHFNRTHASVGQLWLRRKGIQYFDTDTQKATGIKRETNRIAGQGKECRASEGAWNKRNLPVQYWTMDSTQKRLLTRYTVTQKLNIEPSWPRIF